MTFRVLVVDDNLITQRIAAESIKKIGCECRVADNGAEALRELAQGPFDLILMDDQMPVLDGCEATRQIRAGHVGEKNARVPIVAITGAIAPSDLERCLAAGMNDAIHKPFSLSELRAKVQKWLDRDPDDSNRL